MGIFMFDTDNKCRLLGSLLLAAFILVGTFYLTNNFHFKGAIGNFVYYLCFALHFVPFALGYGEAPLIFTYLYYAVVT